MFHERWSTNLSANLNCLFSQNISFSRLVLIRQLNFFSGSSNLQDSFDEALVFFFATVTMKKDRVSFFCFLVKHWKKFLQHNYAGYQSKLYLKK